MDTRTHRIRAVVTRQVLIAVASVALTATTLLGTGTAATAGVTVRHRVVLQDGTGDVWRHALRLPVPDQSVSKPAADITRASVRYRPHAVLLRMRFVNLRRVGRWTEYYAWIKTPGDYNPYDYLRVAVTTGPRHGQGKLWFGGEGSTGCPTATHRIYYVKNMVTIWLPRRCLGWRPTWVRVGFDTWLQQQGYVYEDNPFNDHQLHGWPLTARVYRG